jgi:serine protease Do
MDEILLIETVERYLRGEMDTKEKSFFEEIRKNNADIDQMVVEHTFLFNELDKQANIKAFKHTLYEVESKLAEEGVINKAELTTKAKVVFLWKKYKRNIAVAASIAGIVSIVTTASISTYKSKEDDKSITYLIGEVNKTKSEFNKTKNDVAIIKNKLNGGKATSNPNPDYRATGFLIDGKGFIVTNAHVVNRLKTIYVENNKGDYFTAQAIYTDQNTDLAILKITDTAFKTIYNLPYSINKSNSNLGEQIFTLGFPRNEIVYGEGYVSAKSGNDGDSTSYQVSVSVNPGNSGGPVLNKYGQIIGIITSKNLTADGVVFAAKSKNIFKLIDAAEKADNATNIKLPSNTALRGLDRELQVKKMEEFVFMVVGN